MTENEEKPKTERDRMFDDFVKDGIDIDVEFNASIIRNSILESGNLELNHEAWWWIFLRLADSMDPTEQLGLLTDIKDMTEEHIQLWLGKVLLRRIKDDHGAGLRTSPATVLVALLVADELNEYKFG